MKIVLFLVLCLISFNNLIFSQENQGVQTIIEITKDGLPIKTGEGIDAADIKFTVTVVGKNLSADETTDVENTSVADMGDNFVLIVSFESLSTAVAILDSDEIQITVSVGEYLVTKKFKAPLTGWVGSEFMAAAGINLGNEPTGPVLKINEIIPVCQPAIVDLIAAAVTEGSSPAIAEWTTVEYWEDEACTIPLNNASNINKSGTYYIRAKHETTDTVAEIKVTINPKPDIRLTAKDGEGGAVSTGDIICKGSTLSLSVAGLENGTYNWSRLRGDVNDGFTVGKFPFNAPQNAQTNLTPKVDLEYRVIGENQDGCTDTMTLALEVQEAPVLLLTPKTGSVCSGADLVMTATATPTVPGAGITYTWGGVVTSNQGTATFNSIIVGENKCYVSIKEAGIACMTADTATITVKPVPTEVKITLVDAICENAQNVQFTASAKESGVIFAWTAPAVQGGNTYIYTPTGSGTVEFKVVATLNNCPAAEFTQNITVNPKPVIARPTVNKTDVCYGTDVTLNFTENPAYTYSWKVKGGSVITSAGGDNPTMRIANTGDFAYMVTATDAAGCSDTSSVQLFGHRVIVGTLTKDPASGITPDVESVTLSAPNLKFEPDGRQGATTLAWTPVDKILGDANLQTVTTKQLDAGNHIFEFKAQDEYGCEGKNSETVVVTELQDLEINTFIVGAVHCQGENIKLDVTYMGGNALNKKVCEWSCTEIATLPDATDTPGKSSISIPTKGLAVGEYRIKIEITEENSSRKADSTVTINLLNIPQIAKIGTLRDTCAGSVIEWAPQITYTSPAGGTLAWKNLTEHTDSDITGAAGKAEITVGAGSTANQYEVAVTDANKCVVKDTLTVAGHSIKLNSLSTTPSTVAYGNTVNLTATVTTLPSTDANGLTYKWYPEGFVTASPTTGLKAESGKLSTDTTFKIVASNAWCSDSITRKVILKNFTPLKFKVFPADTAYCFGDKIMLAATLEGGAGTASYTYAWTTTASGITIAGNNTASASVDGAAVGTYVFNLKAGDGVVEKDTTVTITVKQLPTITMTDRPADVCKEGEMTLTATVNSDNGLTAAVYDWKAVRGTILNPNNAEAKVKASGQAGEDQFILKVTDNAGCMLSDTTKVKVHAITLPKVNIPAVACGKTAVLSITDEAACLGGETMTYTWGPAELFGGTQVTGENVTTENIEGNTAYFIEVKESGHYCVDTLTGNISPQGCEFTISMDDVAVCEGGSVQLQVNPSMQTGVTYSWAAVDPDVNAIDQNGVVNASGLTAGQSYDFEVTAIYTVSPGLEVERKDTATVTVWEKPTVTLTQSGGTCVNEIVTFTAEVEKGTIPYIKYVWKGAEQIDGTPDQATLALTGTAQNVSVTVTDKNGCTGTDNKIGIKGDRIVVSLSAEPGHQIAGSTTTLTATVTTGTAASLEFRRIKPDWVQLASPSLATTATDNPVKVSTYQVLAVTAGGCKDSSDYIVNVVDNELIVNGTNLLLCEEQSLDDAYLTARAYGGVVLETNKGYEFTWVAPAGVKLADAATPTNFGEGSKIKLVQMPAAGDYTITVTVKDKNGKSKSTSLLLRVKAKPEIKINGDTQDDMMACVGTEPFKLTATGPAGMTFTWQTPADLKDNTGATQEISVATAGTYTVKVQGRLDGCTTTLSRDLVVNPAPVLAISRTDAAAGWEGCAGTTLELKAAVTAGAKPYTYVWTGATKVAGGKDSLATLTLAAGSNTVTVTVTDNKSCSVSKQQSLTGNTIDVRLTGTPAGQIIAGQSVKLKATVSLGTADTYTYTEVGKAIVLGTKDTLTVKPAASTAYQVVVLSDKRCKDTASYNVNVGSTTPVITVTNVAICQGTADVDVTATTAGGKANYNYTWSSTDPAITITPATDNNKEGASTVKLENLAALTVGTYSINVNVKDADNVSAIQKTLTLTVNARPAVLINGKKASDTTFCVGAGARLMASGATNYTWLTPAGVAGNHDATLAVATASAMNVTEYQVVGKSAAGCVDTATIRVTVQALPEVTITGAKEVCAGTETTLTANVIGTGNYTYSWDGATATADATTYTVKPVKGDNQITLTVKDAKGCEANATHGINGMGMTIQLIANPLKQNYDKDEQIQLQALIQDGGKATNYRFVNTSDPVVVIYNGPQDTVSVRPDNIYIYRVYVTSEDHGCIDSASIKINVKDMPLSIEAEGQAVCQATPDGDLVKFTAEASGGMGDYKYTWGVDPNESPDAIAKITFGNQQETVNKGSEITLTSIKDLPAGKYKIKVTVRDTNILGGPITKDTFTYLTINPLPDVKIKVGDKLLGADTLFCLNTPNVKLTASDSATTTNKWAWTVPAGVTASTTKEQAVTTTTVTTAPVKYKVETTNKFGCVDTAKVNVTIAPLPTVTIEGPAVACVGTNIALKAVAKDGKLPYSYDWEGILDGGQTAIIGDSIVDIGDDGYFTEVYVRVTDKNGCESAQQIHNLEWTTGPYIEKLIVTDSCSKATLVLRGKNLTGAGYTWTLTPSTATGVSGGNDTTYIVTSPSGRYTVEVVAESANKVCTDTGRISGSIMDVQLAVAFKSERDTCGALKMPLTLTKAGTTTVQDVQVKYSYQAFGGTVVQRDTVFNITALAAAAIATPAPGTYTLISVTDTTHGCSTPASGSVRVGFQPKAVITPQNNMGFHNVDSKDVDYVLHVKNPDNTKATYVWTSDPAGKMTTYPGTTDSIHYNLAAAGVDTVKYFLTATGKGDVVCISRDTVSVQVGVLDLPAPVIAIDTNTNRLDIKIHWEPVAGATGYKVYSRKWDPYGLVTADNGGNYTSQTVTGTEFTRSAADVATDTLAFYYVTAVNAGGTESVPSDTVGFVYHVIDATVAEDAINYVFPYIFDMSEYFSSDKIQGLLYYFFNRDEVQLVRRGTWDYATQKFEMKNYTKFGASYKWQPFDVAQDVSLKVGDSYLIGVKAGIKVGFVQFGHLKDTKVSFDVKGNPLEGSSSIVWLPFGMANQNSYNQMTKDLWVLELSADDKVTKAEIKLRAVGRWNIDDLKWDITNPLNGNVWPTLGGGGPFLMKTTLLKPGYQSILFNSKETVVWP